MSRAGKAELEQRVAEISDLLINRVGYRAIVGYAAKRWGLAERQACSYISKAKERILRQLPRAETSSAPRHLPPMSRSLPNRWPPAAL